MKNSCFIEFINQTALYFNSPFTLITLLITLYFINRLRDSYRKLNCAEDSFERKKDRRIKILALSLRFIIIILLIEFSSNLCEMLSGIVYGFVPIFDKNDISPLNNCRTNEEVFHAVIPERMVRLSPNHAVHIHSPVPSANRVSAPQRTQESILGLSLQNHYQALDVLNTLKRLHLHNTTNILSNKLVRQLFRGEMSFLSKIGTNPYTIPDNISHKLEENSIKRIIMINLRLRARILILLSFFLSKLSSAQFDFLYESLSLLMK